MNRYTAEDFSKAVYADHDRLVTRAVRGADGTWFLTNGNRLSDANMAAAGGWAPQSVGGTTP